MLRIKQHAKKGLPPPRLSNEADDGDDLRPSLDDDPDAIRIHRFLHDPVYRRHMNEFLDDDGEDGQFRLN